MGFISDTQSRFEPPALLSRGRHPDPGRMGASARALDRIMHRDASWRCKCCGAEREDHELVCYTCHSVRPGPFDEDGHELHRALAWSDPFSADGTTVFMVQARCGFSIASEVVAFTTSWDVASQEFTVLVLLTWMLAARTAMRRAEARDLEQIDRLLWLRFGDMLCGHDSDEGENGGGQ